MVYDRKLDPPIECEASKGPPGEEDLRISKHWLRLALAATQLGTWEIDLAARMAYLDARAAALLGMPPEPTRVSPKVLVSVIHREDRARILKEFNRLVREGNICDEQFRIVRPDGQVRWMTKVAIVCRSEQGRTVQTCGVLSDITDRKQAEEALRQSLERYRSIFETANNLIASFSSEGVLLDCNRRVEAVLGYSRDEVIGRPGDLVFHAEDMPKVQQAIQKILVDGQAHRWEARMIRKDGQTIHVSVSSAPLRDATGANVQTVCIIQDVTELRRSLEDLRRRDEQLRILNATLEQRVAERTAVAEQRAAQLRRLASRLTRVEQEERRRIAQILHEHFQQLLVAARFNVSRVRRDLTDSALLASIRKADEALDEAIEASRSLTVELSPPILYDAGLSQALVWLGRWMQERYNLEVNVQVDPIADPPDEDIRIALFTAARELLLNVARHAGVNHAALTMNLSDDHRTRIMVTDAGIGFDPERVPLDSSGFGLFSIRERLEMLGGRMEIQSADGRGTRVLLLSPPLVFPATAPLAGGAGLLDAGAAATRRELSGEPARRVRVLVADDHAIVRDGLVRLLEDYPDMEVVAQAADGQTAVDLAGQLRPDVVIMDVSMPGMSGLEATRSIIAQSSHVRVIGLSMHAEADMAERMRQAGAADYVAKSGPPEDLVAAIRRSIQGRDPAGP